MVNHTLTNDAEHTLTRRYIQRERTRLAKQLCAVNDRLIRIGLGQGVVGKV